MAGRPRGSKNGDGAREAKPFTIVYQPSSRGAVQVSVGRRPYPARGDEVCLSGVPFTRVSTALGGGLLLEGHGVVRKDGRTIRVTA